MKTKRSSVSPLRRRLVAASACVLAPALAAVGDSVAAQAAAAPRVPAATATVEQCVTSGSQPERSATFVGEMNAVPGTARMLMRIEVLERLPSEGSFRTVSFPGLGLWLRSSVGVKTYKDLDKVTDLSAPALYRAAIHYRWLNARGHTIRSLDLRTPQCVQPAAATAPGAGEAAMGDTLAPAAPSSASLQ
jgi:hypothetical protein